MPISGDPDPVSDLWAGSRILEIAAQEHLQSAVRLIAVGEPLPFTCPVVIRVVMKALAQSYWLSDPAQGLERRVYRLMNSRLQSMVGSSDSPRTTPRQWPT